MKQTRLYLPSEREDFQAFTPARKVVRDIIFSTDGHDLELAEILEKHAVVILCAGAYPPNRLGLFG